MASRLRIARLDPSAFVPLAEGGLASAEEHQRLQDVIRRHLPQVNASLLAAPVATADGRYVEWYSDLAGQPVPLPSLPEAEQTAARTLLHDRLTALRDLADRLPTVDPGAADLAEPLRRALSYPSDDNVYAVGDQPVITFWGYQPASGAAPAGIPIAAAAAGGVPPDAPPPETPSGDRRRGMPWWLWLLLVLSLVVALAVGAWWYFRDLRWPPWVDYEGLLKAAQEEEVDLRERIDALEADLRERLRRCGLQSDLEAARRDELDMLQRLLALNSQLARLMELCPLKQQVQAAVAEGQAQEEKIDALEARLAAALEECRRKAEAEERRKAEEEERRKAEADAKRKADEERRRKAEEEKRKPPPVAEKPPEKQPSSLPPCPGERQPEEAPDMAVVLDSSGSMQLPANMSSKNVMQGILGGLLGLPGSAMRGGGGPSRLQSAKSAVNKVVRDLPSDVDVGMVVLKDCPRASNLGFFSGAQRPNLYNKVNGLQPMRKTPLADGIAQAGSMVDGVRAPAIIVVVSDGEDTCGGNPCSVAQSLKARKPKMKINVVDITGDGASNCLARATGGRVLTPQSGMAFEQMLKQATKEAQKPAHCK